MLRLNRDSLWRKVAVTMLLLAPWTMLHAKKPTNPGGGGDAPSCTISPAASEITQDQTINFGATSSGIKGSKTYNWAFASGNPSTSTDSSASVTYVSQGSFAVSLTVSGRNGSTLPCSATVEVTPSVVVNQPPTAIANGPYTGTTGIAVSFSSAGSDDSDGSIVSHAWDFGDGGTSTQANPSHSYLANGNYTVSLTVMDNDGDTDSQETTATITNDPPPPEIPNVSINSTSQNDIAGTEAVPEQPLAGSNSYRIFGTNDLGMHCGDFDTRISSILPPFNVLHAQVIRRGGEPDILTRGDGIEVVYSAASNPNDPILAGINAAGEPVVSSLVGSSVFKTNFWDIAAGGTESTALAAYRPFYPPGILDAFAPVPGQGLPMPDVELLYLGPDGIPNNGDEGGLAADQQDMPGIAWPYVQNDPQSFNLFVENQPFFVNFPFGYVSSEVNWFEAAGIPMTAFDDFGRENPWPLYRVQAKIGNTVLASTDVVVPISGEANCGACHLSVFDGGNGAATDALEDNVVMMDEDPDRNLPYEISKEWAADMNLVRLHDQKHGTDLENNTPVVCQSCHYTPALDLAQVGPKGPEDDDANGRQQTNVRSMSNVMHSHHGTLDASSRSPGDDGYEADNLMFPVMPAAIKNSSGIVENRLDRRHALEETCYQCHPGRRTDCLRGAMANGGMLCQDCHGDMQQVGNDFSRDVTPTNAGRDKLLLGSDFYDHTSATPRVPWANEPGCGSCHTGDAMDNMVGTAGTVVNNVDANANVDGIRLFQAFRSGDPKATPIVPGNKRFAENVVETGDAAGNPMLYRVSTGHEGVFCEACHGATHGIWPNKSPVANDNVAAMQLQGHTGTVTECDTCHLPSVFEDSGELELTMGGPHGMHPVGSRHWNTHHKEARQGGGANCRACHGPDGEGTVLSRMAQDRTLECKDNNGDFCATEGPQLFPKGHVVGCNDCHANHL